MHYVSCLVALTGDVGNKIFLERVTTPEVQILRLIHGENSVTDIRIVGDAKFKAAHMATERERLIGKYPRYQEQVVGLWRDSGGKFVEHIHKIGLDSALFGSAELPKPVAAPPDDTSDENEAEGADAEV